MACRSRIGPQAVCLQNLHPLLGQGQQEGDDFGRRSLGEEKTPNVITEKSHIPGPQSDLSVNWDGRMNNEAT